MRDSASTAGLYSTAEAGPGSQAPACSSIPVGGNLPQPAQVSGSQEKHNAGAYPGGKASAMWEVRRLTVGASARSSIAARTAGLREVTIRLSAPSAKDPRYSHAR